MFVNKSLLTNIRFDDDQQVVNFYSELEDAMERIKTGNIMGYFNSQVGQKIYEGILGPYGLGNSND